MLKLIFNLLIILTLVAACKGPAVQTFSLYENEQSASSLKLEEIIEDSSNLSSINHWLQALAPEEENTDTTILKSDSLGVQDIINRLNKLDTAVQRIDERSEKMAQDIQPQTAVKTIQQKRTIERSSQPIVKPQAVRNTKTDRSTKVIAAPIPVPVKRESIVQDSSLIAENDSLKSLILSLKDQSDTVGFLYFYGRTDKEKDSTTIDSLFVGLNRMENLRDSLEMALEILQAGLESSNAEIKDTFFFSARFAANEHLPQNLDELKRFVLSNTDSTKVKILLSSHTDAQGNASYNERLSYKRVKKVEALLVEMGIDNRKIFKQYFGAKYASNPPDFSERRIDIYLIK